MGAGHDTETLTYKDKKKMREDGIQSQAIGTRKDTKPETYWTAGG